MKGRSAGIWDRLREVSSVQAHRQMLTARFAELEVALRSG
jgi:hypothetical protein